MRHGAAEVQSLRRAAALQRSLSHARQKQQKSRGPVAVSLVRAVGAHVKIFRGLEGSPAPRRSCWKPVDFSNSEKASSVSPAGVSAAICCCVYLPEGRPTDTQDGSYRGHRPLLFQRRGALVAGGGPAGPDGGAGARRRRRGAGAVPQGLHAAHVPTSVPQTALRRFYGPPAPQDEDGQEISSAGENSRPLTHFPNTGPSRRRASPPPSRSCAAAASSATARRRPRRRRSRRRRRSSPRW